LGVRRSASEPVTSPIRPLADRLRIALIGVLSQVEVVFDADEPRIHYFFDAPQFFRKQAIMRIET
jgi:hypothetical protein